MNVIVKKYIPGVSGPTYCIYHQEKLFSELNIIPRRFPHSLPFHPIPLLLLSAFPSASSCSPNLLLSSTVSSHTLPFPPPPPRLPTPPCVRSLSNLRGRWSRLFTNASGLHTATRPTGRDTGMWEERWGGGGRYGECILRGMKRGRDGITGVKRVGGGRGGRLWGW